MKKQEALKSKDTGPKERVAFDHKRDMQGSIIDDAKRKAMLKKTMGLENKFSSGNSKFLWALKHVHLSKKKLKSWFMIRSKIMIRKIGSKMPQVESIRRNERKLTIFHLECEFDFERER